MGEALWLLIGSASAQVHARAHANSAAPAFFRSMSRPQTDVIVKTVLDCGITSLDTAAMCD